MEQNTIRAEIEDFVLLMNGFFLTVSSCVPPLGKKLGDINDILKDIHSKSEIILHNEDEHHVCSIENRIKCITHKRTGDKIFTAFKMLPVNIFCSMYNSFENYLSKLYRLVLVKYPSILNSSNSKFTYSDIVEAGSIEKVVNAVLDKELLSFTHCSLVDQVEMLENRFKVDLIVKDDAYKDTLKLSLERNVFTHNAGIINSLFLENCKRLKCKLNDNELLGNKLHFCPNCFTEAHKLLFMVGVQIGQNLWRKVFPEEIGKADSSIINIGYSLLIEGRYDLAQMLHNYSNSLDKFSDEEKKKMLSINHALSYYLADDKETAQQILSKQDWSATATTFQLALDIINERYESAKDIIIRFGKEGPIEPYQYYEWPLFEKFRATSFFLEAMEVVGYDPGHCSFEIQDQESNTIEVHH